MENSVKNVPKLKIILLGDSGVGKTCLINQYVNRKFQKKPILDFPEPLSKEFELKSKPVILQIHDTGGRERQEDRGLDASFFNNAKACMLVYDVNDPRSLENLENWHNEFNIKVFSSPSSLKSFPFVVIGNKADIDGGREVDHERATKWCQDKRIAHFLTSAKDNKHVVEAFQYVADLALNYKTNDESLTSIDENGENSNVENPHTLSFNNHISTYPSPPLPPVTTQCSNQNPTITNLGNVATQDYTSPSSTTHSSPKKDCSCIII